VAKIGAESGTSTVATFTERVDAVTSVGTGHVLEVSTKAQATAGSSGTATVTWSLTTSLRALAVSIGFREETPDPGTAVDFRVTGRLATTTVGEISLASHGTPPARTNHSIKVRARVTSGTGTLNVALYESTTNRSGDLTQALTSTLTDYTIAIPDANAGNISSYANLGIRF